MTMIDDCQELAYDTWSIHRAMGFARTVSLAKAGAVSPKQIEKVSVSTACIGWPPRCSSADIDLGRRFGFDAQAAATLTDLEMDDGPDFVEFGSVDDERAAWSAICEFLNDFSQDELSFSGGRASFAHLHDDVGSDFSRGQAMLILENPIGHRLLSIDAEGREIVITPAMGDVILLDTDLPHAVLTNQSGGVAAARKAPMAWVTATGKKRLGGMA